MALSCTGGGSGWILGKISSKRVVRHWHWHRDQGVNVPEVFQSCGEVAPRDLGSGHGEVGWGWGWRSNRSFPAIMTDSDI